MRYEPFAYTSLLTPLNVYTPTPATTGGANVRSFLQETPASGGSHRLRVQAHWQPHLEDIIMKNRKRNQWVKGAQTREGLNRLMEALAYVIAQRQMKRHWVTGHRTTLPSII